MHYNEKDGKISFKIGTPGKVAIFEIEKDGNQYDEKNGFKNDSKYRIKGMTTNTKSIKNMENIENTQLNCFSDAPCLSVNPDGNLIFSNFLNENSEGISSFFSMKIIVENESKNYAQNDEKKSENRLHENSASNDGCNNDVNDKDNDRIHSALTEHSLRTFFKDGFLRLSNIVEADRISECLRYNKKQK